MEKTKYGFNLTGVIKIFEKEYEGKKNYSTSIGNKKTDGTYENLYIPLTIKDNPSKEIEVLEGFLSFYTKQDGTKVVKAVIQKYVNRLEKQDENVFVVTEEETPF